MKSITFKYKNPEQINIEELHQESRSWLSSVAFWKDEIRFMHNLINDNFIYFLSKDQKGSLDALVKKITNIEKTMLDALKTKVITHEKGLSSHLKSHTELDKQNFTDEHIAISKEFDFFQNNYRLVKSELFRFAEEVMKDKHIKQLLT